MISGACARGEYEHEFQLERFAGHVHDGLLASWNTYLRAQQAANAWLPHLLGQGEHTARHGDKHVVGACILQIGYKKQGMLPNIQHISHLRG